MSKLSRSLVAVGSLIALTFVTSPAKAQVPDRTLDHKKLCSPADPSIYRTTSDNVYFPMQPGQLSVFLDEEGEGDGPVGLRIEVLSETENLYHGNKQIVTRVIEETEFLEKGIPNGTVDNGEEVLEISRNFFAQSLTTGTVCYFGESVDIFEDGGVVHDGSWRADTRGNAPGIIMPANPKKGDVYLQEDAFQDDAADLSRVVKFNTATFQGTQYKKAMHTLECNLAEDPSCTDLGDKTYAPGVGLVQDGGLELTDWDAGV